MAEQAVQPEQSGERLYRASLKQVRVSPRKARLVVDLIRGRNVVQALGILDNLSKKSSPVVKNLLKSAIANAEQHNDANFDVDTLKVKVAYVDPGPMLKRFRPRAMGRAAPIRKRTSRITLMVG
ncbi:MAG TPA: 50S ribosomal protein L22 [bacterium]|nr:50S ribosomal protein L22 [bacterium]